jgi:hypothetical protein
MNTFAGFSVGQQLAGGFVEEGDGKEEEGGVGWGGILFS